MGAVRKIIEIYGFVIVLSPSAFYAHRYCSLILIDIGDL